jgi:hypothetical protein
MYSDLDPDEKEPSERQLESKERLLNYAKAVQAKALADEKALADSQQPSEEEMREWVQAQIDNMVDYDFLTMEADQMESKEATDKSAEVIDKETSQAVRGQVGRGENVGMFTPLREESDEDEEPCKVLVEEK